jgi:hypothetical protein
MSLLLASLKGARDSGRPLKGVYTIHILAWDNGERVNGGLLLEIDFEMFGKGIFRAPRLPDSEMFLNLLFQ